LTVIYFERRALVMFATDNHRKTKYMHVERAMLYCFSYLAMLDTIQSNSIQCYV